MKAKEMVLSGGAQSKRKWGEGLLGGPTSQTVRSEEGPWSEVTHGQHRLWFGKEPAQGPPV